MTKIGEFPLGRSDGARDFVDLHEPGTFDHEPLLLQLSDGRYGSPYLRPLGEGDTGLLVQASDGSWWQATKAGQLLIEGWESGYRDTDRWNWTDSDFSGSSSVHDVYSLTGTYSLRLTDFYRTAAMPDYPNPAPHLPLEVGETVEAHFIMPHSTDIDVGQQYYFAFLIQDAPHHTTTSAGANSWDNLYTLRAMTGSNDRLQLSLHQNGSVSTLDTATHVWESGRWYRFVVSPASDGITCDLYIRSESDPGTWYHEATVTGPAPEWPSGGIGMRNSGGGKSNWDEIRLRR